MNSQVRDELYGNMSALGWRALTFVVFIFTSGAAWAELVAYYAQAIFAIVVVVYLRLPDKTWPRTCVYFNVCVF